MRLIGHLKDEASAKTFSGFLVSVDIRNQIESDSEGWAVWIHSEDQIEAGQQALAAFMQNPADKKYQIASQVAEVKERERQRDEAKAAKRIHDRDRIWSRINLAPLTLFLIAVSVVVTCMIGMEPNFHDIHMLAIDDLRSGFLTEVQAGQVWRLITPIFIHFGPLHLIFNMLWLYELGSMIEVRYGTFKLALFVVVVAALSNTAQYVYDGPFFGGMSGVVYGLFGYIWMRGEFDPESRLGLPSNVVWMMIIWFFLCVFGLVGDVANVAHGVGLVVGMIWGAAPPMARKLFRD